MRLRALPRLPLGLGSARVSTTTYYQYSLRLPCVFYWYWGEVRSFQNLRDCSVRWIITRAVRDLRVPALYGFYYGILHVTDSARVARAPDIWILAYRDITAGVKIDLEASWIFVKDP